MHYDQLSENNELLLRIADGDEGAYTVFFNTWYPILRPFVKRFFSDADQVEDALQETFIKVWLHRDQLPQITNLRGWLNTIVSRTCINAIRSSLTRSQHAMAQSIQQASSPVTPEEKTTIAEINKLVAIAVEKMPPARKRIYQLSRTEGMNPSEIADTLSISVNTVRNTLVIALREIRHFLSVHGHIVSLIWLMIKYF